jgi:beta-galactosidase
MAHHPMAQAMLRACDKLGMYVMDESFDMWTRFKSDFDYAMNFDEWWERDLESMVKKDFNHPSVIMYSLGNEIPEIGTDRGSQIVIKCQRK